jgi:hypothetical protein
MSMNLARFGHGNFLVVLERLFHIDQEWVHERSFCKEWGEPVLSEFLIYN